MSEGKVKKQDKKLPAKSLRSDVNSAISLLGGGKSSRRNLHEREASVQRVRSALKTPDGMKEIRGILDRLKDRGKEDQDFWEKRWGGIKAIESMIKALSA